MKQVLIVRESTSDEGTFGTLYVDGKKICSTGEVPKDYDDDGVYNERNYECIPAGTYIVKHRYGTESSKFKYDHYILQDVPNRSFILIHKGNYCGNVSKGFKSDSEGCIIVGMNIGSLNGQKSVMNSNTAFTLLRKLLGTDTFELTIKESY